MLDNSALDALDLRVIAHGRRVYSGAGGGRKRCVARRGAEGAFQRDVVRSLARLEPRLRTSRLSEDGSNTISITNWESATLPKKPKE